MKNWLLATLLLGVAVLTVPYAPSAKADEWDKRSVITFTAPVELPGVVLSPGTYVFKLLDSPADRNIVQVFSKDETKLYATILAIPDYRTSPAPTTIVKFEERSHGAPEAIKEWFYPGDNSGQEFAYPRGPGVELAKTTNQNVVTIPNATAQNITKPVKTAQEPPAVALKTAPVTAVNPKGAEVEIAQAATPKPSVATAAKPTPAQTATVPATTPNSSAQLPKTASQLPLIFLVGMVSLGLSLGLRSLAKRVG
jgi:hypothetical protein